MLLTGDLFRSLSFTFLWYLPECEPVMGSSTKMARAAQLSEPVRFGVCIDLWPPLRREVTLSSLLLGAATSANICIVLLLRQLWLRFASAASYCSESIRSSLFSTSSSST
jgi:hypothetical protein